MARRRRCCLGAAHLAAPPPLGKTCHRKKKRLGETVQRRLWRFFPSRILQVGVCCEPDTPPMLAQLAPIANRQSPIAKPAKPAWVRNAPTRGFLAWGEREREREREREAWRPWPQAKLRHDPGRWATRGKSQAIVIGAMAMSDTCLQQMLRWGSMFLKRQSDFLRSQIRGSIVVSISACHAEDPGSIPGRGVSQSPDHLFFHAPRPPTDLASPA
jgi:hypothetical protein